MTLPLIKVVQLTVTNRCQCRCKHCGVSTLRKMIKGELTLEQIDRLFQDFKLAGCLVVDLFGGEPTLRRDLFEIIKLGKAYGFYISLETNGYVIDDAYMNGLAEAKLDQIYLSLDDYRAEVHDEIRGKRGTFDRAVRALELGAKTDIIMHVSTVPQSPRFFIDGDINRFMEFVLKHGAEQVRLLLPRFVGDSIHEGSGPMCAGEERELFSYLSSMYFHHIYLHTPGTPLWEKNLCTAKQVFCHVMSNGWVAPCPYFPLVFGDVTREPIIDIFERIQSHPLVRLGGDFCPMRNETYINTHIREMGLDKPFFLITVDNQIDLGAPCKGDCPGCVYAGRVLARPANEVIRDMEKVDSDYTRIEFFGGNGLLRNDLFEILDCVPEKKKVILWVACGQAPKNAAFMERLRSYSVEAIKVNLALPFRSGKSFSGLAADLEEALRDVQFFCSFDLPIHVYIPMELIQNLQGVPAATIRQLGVERLYAYSRDLDQPLVNSVLCFGRVVGLVKLLWVRRRYFAENEFRE
jgi:MoaA/NifB/PqqE/SkfB family radical SAM enzyme